MEAVETKKCPLCEREVEVSKFRMHDIGCSRQNYKCRECGACVAKADKEKHEETAHVAMTCEDCGFSAMKVKYGNHQEECKMKPKQCEFCEKSIKHFEWDEHYQMCGSKTKMC